MVTVDQVHTRHELDPAALQRCIVRSTQPDLGRFRVVPNVLEPWDRFGDRFENNPPSAYDSAHETGGT